MGFHYVELRRWQDLRRPGSVNNDPIFQGNSLETHEAGYPGGIFDPLKLSDGDLKQLKEKEIKNGRLAMLAFVGFVAQERTTGLNPLAALELHLDAPTENTIFTNWSPIL